MKGFFQPKYGKSQSQLEIPLEEINYDKFSVFWLHPRNRRFSLFSAFTVTTQTLLSLLCSPTHNKSDPSNAFVFLSRLF